MHKLKTIPRKMPSQERSRATIDAILDATARVLQREGFDRASTNRVAEAAGVSIGSLYQYFPSKEALVAALAERHMQQMFARLSSEMARVSALPLEQAVRALVGMMLDAHAVDPKLHRVLIEQVPRIGRLERVHEVEARMTELTSAYLRAHHASLRVRDLELAAFVVVTTVEALTHQATLHHPERLKDDRLAREIVDIVVRYLRRD